ncbi:hypothetical protein [endosymbiont of unidentified scaly snail isolate Monju]|uniref:hypothetical protein n=1 Tax=endosymbiont of unidentified scaly snail isolate Monju TaxID=1248727 RepID=UPI0011DDB547|nr:hypothetical protein [endosymbiont of unidentified scaly snail isolate Monju]
MSQNINIKKGLWRLWIVATFIWLLSVAIYHAASISYWAGYHFQFLIGLVETNKTFFQAIEEKKKAKALILSCKLAKRVACDFDLNKSKMRKCMSTEEFKKEFIDNLESSNIIKRDKVKSINDEIDNSEIAGICEDMLNIHIPEINTLFLVTILMVPLSALVIYFIVLWFLRGFIKN